MEKQSSDGNENKRKSKILTVAGITIILSICALTITISQFGLDIFSAVDQGESNATLVSVLNESLLVQENIANLQSEALDSESDLQQTDIAYELKNLRNTQVVLEETRISIDSSLPSPITTIAPTEIVSSEAISSQFDGLAKEGWTVTSGIFENPGTGGSGGGLNNGCLVWTDDDSGTSYFVAPSRYLGNWEDYSAIELDLWSKFGEYFTEGSGFHGDIYLASGYATAYRLFTHRPDESWETIRVPLSDDDEWVFSGGANSILDILINVTEFQIRAEFGAYATDITGLDNIKLIP